MSIIVLRAGILAEFATNFQFSPAFPMIRCFLYNALMNQLTNSLLSWVEIDSKALIANTRALRAQTGSGVTFCSALKANGYGHGLTLCATILQRERATDWIAVNSLWEAEKLRAGGITLPLYIMGYIPLSELEGVFTHDVRIVVYNQETVIRLEEIGKKLHKTARVHLKVETGNHRQGVYEQDIPSWIALFNACEHVVLEGLSTHFANIEDTHDHSYAEQQIQRFDGYISQFKQTGMPIPFLHSANSAATILFSKTHGTMVRAGIALYGLWPSDEVRQEANILREQKVSLFPVLSWKSRVAQVRPIPKNSFIGYGCSYRTERDMVIAIIPVGYYDGLDRGLSNNGEVLIHGRRAKLCGRVCMNMIVVDITDISDVHIEDEVTLIGRDGDEEITAGEMAEKIGTIHYEVVTRICESVPRIEV